MPIKQNSIALILLLVALILGLVYYNEKIDSYEKEFSPSLNNWFKKGKSFNYKMFKVFYVHELLDSSTSESATTILFLHGFPTSSFDFYKVWNLFLNEKNSETFSRKYTSLLAFDHLGYGFSDKPENYNYTIVDKTDLVQMLLAELEIKSVVLVAHDMSDSVALELIRRDNLKALNELTIEKCVLMNGGIITSTLRPIISQKILRTNYIRHIYARSIIWPLFRYVGDFSAIFGQLTKPNTRDLYDFYLTIKYNNGFSILPSTIEYMSERERLNHVWYEALNQTDVPVMFIYGPADPINPSSLFPQKLRADIPKISLRVLSDLVGHYPQFEDPFTVFELIKTFLN